MNVFKIILIVSFFCLMAGAVLAFDPAKTGLVTTAGQIGYTQSDLPTLIGKYLGLVFGFLGLALFLFVLFGGWIYMKAGGDAAEAKRGKNWIVNSIIGLIIIVSAYALSTYIIEKISTASGGTTTATPAGTTATGEGTPTISITPTACTDNNGDLCDPAVDSLCTCQ
jgi:hypothetical protein